MELELVTLFSLFGVALIAGFIDAIAGGGGLLTVPALLATGMPPALVLEIAEASKWSLCRALLQIVLGQPAAKNPLTIQMHSN